MKATDNRKQIRKDCLSSMRVVTIAQFLVDLSSVLIPTLTASVFGEMTHALLQASYVQARSLLPRFILYMFLSVLTVPLFTMLEYLSMGKRGYDMFLVKRLLCKPLSEIQQYDIGDILERLEGTLGDFSWNTVYLYSLPFSSLCYIGSTLFLLLRQGMSLAVVLLVIAIPSLSVLKAHMAGGKKALHERKQSEYNERRKTEEMSLCASKAFLLAYHMENHTAKMLGGLFQQYMRQDGEKKVRFQAGLDALDFLLQQAIPLCILMIGIGLTKAGNLPIGTVVTGYSYDAKRLIFNTFRIGFIKCIMNADRNYQIAKVEDRMFGSFIEQQGSCIGNGIYEPTHPAADEGGFRQDVLERTRKLNLSIIRFPGGN